MCNDTILCCVDGSLHGNLNAFWNSRSPTLSPCLEHTILIWIPCAIFWLLLPFEILRLSGGQRRIHEKLGGNESKENGRIGRVLFFSRLICLCTLLACSVVRLAIIRHIDNAWASIVSAFLLYPITVALMIVITILRRRKLVAPPSAYIWITLCSFFIFSIPELLSTIENAKIANVSATGTFFVQFAILLVSVITFCISDPLLEKGSHEWPEELLSFPNILIFWWITRLLIQGYRNILSINDVFTVSSREQTRPVYEVFEKNLRREFGQGRDDGRQKLIVPAGDWPMIRVLARTFYKPVLAAALMQLIYVMLVFIAPVVITWLMQFIRNSEEPLWHGFIYVVILFGQTLYRSFTTQFHYHFMNKFGVRARAAIVAAVYRKSLTMSSEARRVTNTGEIVNLMAVDSMRFIDVAFWLQMVWSAPLQVIFGLYVIYGAVGHAVWAGVAVMAVIFTGTSIVSKQMQKLQMKQLYEKDRRMKLLTEMLNGMKVLKLYAWEPAFERLVELIRAQELKHLKMTSYLFGGISVSYCSTNLLACLSIFGVYCLIDPTHNVTAEVAFVVLTVFNIIYIPFTQLPLAASYIMMTFASITRLRNFFCQEDLVTYVESRKSDALIEVENGSFSWEFDSKDLTLQDINLNVKSGQVIAVAGPVGSGKSSLISAICGEMRKRSGSVFINGSVAYVAQQAWIQNMTVRDNILFGKPYDERRYEKIVQACSLTPDLALLADGDMTTIGERGSNLSGGQKQRISLARAVYQNADIYLLDDPLSAVDVHVGKAIFDAVIGPNGILKKKGRIFVTHGVQYLPSCDSIVLMETGKFLAVGTFDELGKEHGIYADFAENNFMPEVDEKPPHKLSVSEAGALRRLVSRQQTNSSLFDAAVSDMILERLASFRRSSSSITCSRHIKPTATSEDQPDDPVEEVNEGKISWKTYWTYAKYGGSTLLLHTIFLAAAEFSYMSGTMWLETWTDSVPEYPPSNSSLSEDSRVISGAEGIGVLGAITVIQFISTIGFSLFFVYFVMRTSTKVHKRLLGSILRAPMSFFDTTPSGRLTNRFGKDMNTIDNQIHWSASAVLQFSVVLIGYFIPISYASPLFVPVLLPLLVIYVLLQKFYVTSARQFRRLEAVTRSPIYSHFQESIHGIATIRAYKQEDRFSTESDRLVDINDSVQMTLLTSNRWLGIQLDFIGNLVVTGACISAILSRNTMLPGLVGLMFSYVLNLTELLDWGVRELSFLETEIVALERVNEYMDIAPEAEWTSTESVAASLPKEWPARGAVEFDTYSTSYRPGLPLVLKDFKCRVRAGQKVGVVGRTGAGKSSLTLALFRMIEPVNGTILIDGVDISRVGLHDLRKKLTIIPQEPALFTGTLRQNIDPFEQYADADLFRALELSHLNGFVQTLEGGLSHEISEGGNNLSVGQRQLLCLARALLRKTKILILDEATASVDVETDALIQRTVREQFADCTIITIAHRLNTILDYDRVMVLDSGRLVEYDSPGLLIDDEHSEFGRMIQEAGIRVSSSDLLTSVTL